MLMRRAVQQFLSIASLTALEASRQPIYLLLTTTSILFIALLPLIITHVISDSARMVRDSSLAVLFVTGLILGCYAATATISHELKKGTLASIVTKPVNRILFFLAKFSGVAIIMLVYSAITTMATMLSTRTAATTFQYDWWGIGPLLIALLIAYAWGGWLNYRQRTPFVSKAFWLVTFAVVIAFAASAMVQTEPVLAGHHGHNHGPVEVRAAETAIPWNIVPAGMLIGLAILLICAFAATLSLKFDLIPTVSVCFVIFIVGLMSDYLFGQHADENWLYGLIYGLMPNWQHFWAVDAIGRNGIPWAYTLQAAGYAAVYATVVLSAGIATFYRMEVK